MVLFLWNIAGALLVSTRSVNPDVLIADFEGPSYGMWVATGSAFGSGPAQGTLPGQMHVSGFEGRSLVNSFLGGDDAMGKLTSPEFEVSRSTISFLIGGGGWAGKTCMNLWIDGKLVRTASGPNVRDGGSEALERMNWNVAEFLGRKAFIEIVDDAAGSWGHINVDQIVLTDNPLPGVVDHPVRAMHAQNRYLNLPIRNDAPVRRLTLTVDGEVVRDFEAALTDKEPDFWVFVDLTPWMNRPISLSVDRLPMDGLALTKVEQADELRGSEPLYAETLRPRFHFSSRRGWLNDPNGLVYADGEYHLYYQHNPFGWWSRNMHWGHAVSPDLVHWTELPTALPPHQFGDWVWSGSAVVDPMNTSCWKTGAADVIVAAFTSTARGECIAWSADRGRTFTEYEGNPVVTHSQGEGRDPRLFWFGPHRNTHDGHWVMAVYSEDRQAPEPDRRGVAFYTSHDLKRWTYRSRIGGFYECPDIFELPVDGGSGGSKWVLTAANSRYLLGQFDGLTFTPDEPRVMLPGNWSDRFYAAQTFSATPDGRRIQIGWGRIDTPGMPFNQMMSFPCELTLRTTTAGVRLFSWPVKEIASLYDRTWTVRDLNVSPDQPVASDLRSDLFDVFVEVDAGRSGPIDLLVRGMQVRIDPSARQIDCAGQTFPLAPRDGRITLRILADRTSIEIFGNDGEVAALLAGEFDGDAVEVRSVDRASRIDSLTVHTLRSSWDASK